ncbi:hypothetical protein QBC46DRAFT_442663 [Diplogelasinospora grovesii]|uniref:Uncharacterized protein n=1 Tax=Diplogelasinospora grovesii TaxID=303347 RepID=A0AAN6S1L8_9PEZI|nr:hypothetical protein QBC46DRAFT_442663 [Diplogelasinospora grovesii]
MSWMDSWSRPSKHQPTPAPFYLHPNGNEIIPYCKSCDEKICSGSREIKYYCSRRCRSSRPGRVDREIEAAFVRFLTGEEEVPGMGGGMSSKAKGKGKGRGKGDKRVLVPCDVVEEFVFGERKTNNNGDRADGKNGRNRTEDGDDGNTRDNNAIEADIRSGTRIRPQQQVSEVNGSVGGEKGWAERIEETEAMKEKREEGQRRALEREMVRGAARRGVIFGFLLPGGHADKGDGIQGKGENRRKCEAVMQGKVVEPSFAKGDWGVRWREE